MLLTHRRFYLARKKIVFLCYSVFCLNKHGIAVHVYGVDNKKRHNLCPVSVLGVTAVMGGILGVTAVMGDLVSRQ